MTVFQLSPHALATISNGLRVAAERFDEHAADFRRVAQAVKEGGPDCAQAAMFTEGGALRLAEQFSLQAAESRSLAARIEQTDHITLEGDYEDID